MKAQKMGAMATTTLFHLPLRRSRLKGLGETGAGFQAAHRGGDISLHGISPAIQGCAELMDGMGHGRLLMPGDFGFSVTLGCSPGC